MATLTKSKITKQPEFTLTEEEYSNGIKETIVISDVEIKVEEVLETVNTVGFSKTSSFLGIRQNHLIRFLDEHSDLADDFEKRKELLIVESMLKILSETKNYYMAYSVSGLSKSTGIRLLLKFFSISEVCDLVTEKEVRSYMSQQASQNAVRTMSRIFKEPVKEILKYLTPSALERYKSQLEVEKQTAIVVGLKGLGMNYITIAKELNLNPRQVGRLLDKYKRGTVTCHKAVNLFNRVAKMRNENLSIDEIANKLELKTETIDMILEKKKV